MVEIEQADALIALLGLAEQVEDYEQNEFGHVYTLVDGTSVVIDALGQALHDDFTD